MLQAHPKLPRRGVDDTSRAAAALRRLVDRVSHRSGLALETMSGATVTLPQVLLMNHVAHGRATSPSELADIMRVSLAAVSQMINRLVHQGFLNRREDPSDRRRKALATTAAADSFLRKLEIARSRDFELGLAPIAPELLAQVAALLERAVAQLEDRRACDERLRAATAR
jgi:DNA-binding MarR family transcriptional regulator